jgi:hypothetical protein
VVRVTDRIPAAAKLSYFNEFNAQPAAHGFGGIGVLFDPRWYVAALKKRKFHIFS